MEDPRIISALFIFLKMAYYNVLINTPTVALGNGTHRLTKYGEFFAVPRGNTRKECQDVDCQTFSVFDIFHYHKRVKKSCIVLVAG